MWSGDQSNAEGGILLLEPKHKHPCGHIMEDPKASCLGGRPTYYPNDLFHNNNNNINKSSKDQSSNILTSRPTCDVCGETMYLILQLYAPLEENELDRSLYVFGCNSASCVNQTFGEEENDKNDPLIGKRYSNGGGGVIKCLRSQSQRKTDNVVLEKRVEPSKSNIETTSGIGGGGGGGGGWGDDHDHSMDSSSSSSDDDSVGISMDDLEAMLSIVEAKEKDGTLGKSGTKKQPSRNRSTQKHPSNSQNDTRDTFSFPQYEVDVYDEPLTKKAQGEDEDDEIGMAQKDDKIVQGMLAKYLKEEEDSDLVAMIGEQHNRSRNGASGGNSNANNANMEKEERLSPEHSAFLSFTDRIKRAPLQVARYAYGGTAMWSM